MKKNYSIIGAALVIIAGFAACRKHHHDDSEISVANLSATYKLTSIIETETAAPSISYEVLPNLTACIKDDEISLITNLTVKYSDVGNTCTPKDDDSGTWAIINDSLALSKNFFSTYLSAGKITSFDGKTLIVTSSPWAGLKHVTTLVKK